MIKKIAKYLLYDYEISEYLLSLGEYFAFDNVARIVKDGIIGRSKKMDALEYLKGRSRMTMNCGIQCRQSEFLKLFPTAPKINGVMDVCPMHMDKLYNPHNGCSRTDCTECKRKYWSTEVK